MFRRDDQAQLQPASATSLIWLEIELTVPRNAQGRPAGQGLA